MLTDRVDAGNGNFERHYIVTGIDEEMLERARLIFEEYHHSGVIQNSHFADDEWVLTNQVRRTTLWFNRDELTFTENARKWMGCSYRCFADAVKAYTVFHWGSLGLSGIRELAQGIGVGFGREMRAVEKSIRTAMPKEIEADTVVTARRKSERFERGEDAKDEKAGGVSVVQNFYTEGNDYAKQQQEAARRFKEIAREIG